MTKPLNIQSQVKEKVTIKLPESNEQKEPTITQLSHIDQYCVMFEGVACVWFYEEMLDFQELQNSLLRVLPHFPFLCGRLVFQSNGSIGVVSNNEGFPFTHAFVPKVSSKDFNLSRGHFIKDKVPLMAELRSVSTSPVMSIILTEFENGGCSIGLTILHCLFDGWSFFNFYSIWSKEHRGETVDYSNIIFNDHSFLVPKDQDNDNKNVESQKLSIDHQSTYIQNSFLDHMVWTGKLLANIPFNEVYFEHITSEELATMKQVACKDLPSGSFLSTNEVLTAHLWKVFSCLRNIPPQASVKVGLLCNLRGRKSDLPKTYFRNSFTSLAIEMTMDELQKSSLSVVASKVHSVVRTYKDEKINHDLKILAEFGKSNPTLKRVSLTIDTLQYDTSFTNWMSFPIYDSDFGKGAPIYFDSIGPPITNIAAMIPAPPSMGGCIITSVFNQKHKEMISNEPFQSMLHKYAPYK